MANGLVESPDMPDFGSSAALPHPFHPETGNGNRNLNDVIPNVGRGVRGYYNSRYYYYR